MSTPAGSAAKATVFVVDDDPAVCRAIAAGIEKVVGLPVASFPTAEEFLNGFDPEQAGCLVLDVKMPGMSGLELQELLIKRGATLPVIMISGHAEVPTAVAAMRAGAIMLLQKPFDMRQLEDQVRQALAIDADSRENRRQRGAVEARIATLTDREREIMALLIDGKTNKEISLALGVSVPTVDKHRWKVLEKMDVQNTVELVRRVGDLKL